jgi:hypothetical protein
MDKSELWGTFSVRDHLRRRAFVAELLIYDRLVIPYPPPGDGVEYGRWRAKLASTEVVEIRGARRRAERPSTSLARCAAA